MHDMKMYGGTNNTQIGKVDSIHIMNQYYEDRSVILKRTMEKANHRAEVDTQRIEEDFIKTGNYRTAEKQLKENDILILTGYPMMGKTETALALLYEFSDEFAIFSLEKVDELLEHLDNMDCNKELFFLDDLLGQLKYEISPTEVKSLRRLIDIVLRSKGEKKLILTVRETILSDFFQQYPDIKMLLELNGVLPININFHSSELRIEYIKGSLDRAKTDNGLSLDSEKVAFLCEKESLKIITESICFNPLVINRLWKPQKNISLEEYKEQFYYYMTDAEFIWKKELGALNEYSLLYLYTIYSLTDKKVKKEIVDQCFMALIKNDLNYKLSMQEVVDRMNGVLVNIQDQKDSPTIGLFHPSLNQYIEKYILDNLAMRIVGHACYLDQLERLEKYAKDTIKQKLLRPREFFTYGLLANEEETFHALFMETKPIIYAKYLLKYNIRNKSLEMEILKIAGLILQTPYFSLMRYEDIVVPFFLSDFYDTGIYLDNPTCFQTLLNISGRENMCRLLEKKGYYTNGYIDYRKLSEKDLEVADIIRRCLEGEAASVIIQATEELVDDCLSEKEENEEIIVEDVIDELLDYDSPADAASHAINEALERSKIINFEYEADEIVLDVLQNQLYDMIQEKIDEI